MSEPWVDICGAMSSRLLLIADHASSSVPEGVQLGVAPTMMDEHVAIDIGVAPLAQALCVKLHCPGILGGVSRLVIDLNREQDAAGLIPETSDGRIIPGNSLVSADERARRIALIWKPYHDHISEKIIANKANLLISLHSFTPKLRIGAADRPWQIGILYNQDERAARIALPQLQRAGIVAGDNLPYSGKVLNATMNRHGEANHIAYLGIEVRQDLIGDAAGVTHWCAQLAPVIHSVRSALATDG